MASNIAGDMGGDMSDMFVSGFNSGNYSTGSPQFLTPETTGNGEQTSAPKLNPRSCVTCRRRKVRCDKHEPCSNCTKVNVECVFPPPGRAPRKPRRPHDAELLKRLRRLESVVDSLGGQVDDDDQPVGDAGGKKRGNAELPGLDLSPEEPSRRSSLEYGLGRLMINGARSRYVSNEFWSTLGEEIAEIRNVLDSPSSEEEADPPPPDVASDPTHKHAHHQGFLFGYSSLMYDMSKLHPSPSQIFILWENFKENVDPVLKILHGPTVKNVIMKAAVSASSLTKANESLFYSICFASVVSMTDDQCRSLLDDDKNKLMQKYRFATEQALARANFLNSSNLMILQAFVMFLMCVKFIDISRSIYALSGLAMSQAQAQGLHRDGTNFDLNPFDTEMRRRLWWHVSLLDARAAEDYGADPAIYDQFSDTKMPMNVNDKDIWPGMTDPPHEESGASDMTFCLIRFELGHIQKRLRIMASVEADMDRKRCVEEREQLIEATHRHMQEKYFRYCDPNSPLLWVASTVGKLILAKMWLFVHHPRLIRSDVDLTNDLKRQIFLTSVEVVEFGVLLMKTKDTAKWAWLFKTYMQWHAVAYVLLELCNMPAGPESDRAWQAVDAVYNGRLIEQAKGPRGVLWRPLKQLYVRAKAYHAQQQRQMQQNISANTAESPESHHSGSMSSDSQSTPGPTTKDNWLGANPYTNVVSATGDAFGLDFSDPIFNEINLYNMNDMNNGQAPSSTLPFEWTPGVMDYTLGYQGQSSNLWGTSMQQEWH